MRTAWLVIAALALGTYALRLAGTQSSTRLQRSSGRLDLIGYLAPAVLGGLVAVATFGDGPALVVDSRAAGVAAAVVALLCRLPTLAVIAVAVVVAAGVRALA